jgi:lipopolysaccharide/colanic/teichoic acid biosynthesis glycosyltransferase
MTVESINSVNSSTKKPFQKINRSFFSGRFFKRLFDLIVSGLALLLLSPLFAITAIRIKRESPGPVFYRGPRLGRGGKVFHILKFRTMRETPESYNGSRITARDDERITPLGLRLRESKLNEFPQLWNVFKGEMSLVGPRPEDPQVAAHWLESVRHEICSIRPGITSPASVLYRHEEQLLTSGNVMDDYLRRIMPDKQRLDLLYVRTHSLFSDLDILLLTFISLFRSPQKRPISEQVLFSGLLFNFIRRHMSWFMVDALVVFLTAGFVGVLWRLSGPLDIGWGPSIAIAAAMALLFSVINNLLGLGRVSWRKASIFLVFDLAASSGCALTLLFIINWNWPGEKILPPGMVVEIGIIAFLGFIVTRYRRRLLTGLATRFLQLRRQTNALGERVIIVGAGDTGQLAGWLLQKSELSHAFNVVGMVDDDPRLKSMTIDGYSVLGSTRELPAIVQRYNIGVLLYAITQITSVEEESILSLCRSLPVRIVIIPDLIKTLQNSLLPNGPKEPCEEYSL